MFGPYKKRHPEMTAEDQQEWEREVDQSLRDIDDDRRTYPTTRTRPVTPIRYYP